MKCINDMQMRIGLTAGFAVFCWMGTMAKADLILQSTSGFVYASATIGDLFHPDFFDSDEQRWGGSWGGGDSPTGNYSVRAEVIAGPPVYPEFPAPGARWQPGSGEGTVRWDFGGTSTMIRAEAITKILDIPTSEACAVGTWTFLVSGQAEYFQSVFYRNFFARLFDQTEGEYVFDFVNMNNSGDEAEGMLLLGHEYVLSVDLQSHGHTGDGSEERFTFESQVVPAPGAVVLGMIGLGMIGQIRRRFA